MNDCLVTFRSVTPAQRGERLLRRMGFTCNLRRTPRWMEEQGCGYSLRLRRQDIMTAIALLRRHQIPFHKVYLQLPEGTVEELEV